MRYIVRIAFVLLALLLASCASSKPAENAGAAPAPVVQDSAKVDSVATVAQEPIPEGNKDIAQESFLRYLYLQHREEPDMAIVFLQHAAENDPANRFLSFTLAEELAEKNQIEYAMQVAERAKKLPGKSNAAQDGLLASLYLKTGAIDSAKTYYKKAIAENEEDYTKIYEYSLFLEWEEPKDVEELLRVYAILLPRINYMRNMFNRTAQLMLQNGRDSAFCALLTDAFRATGDKSFLTDKIGYFEEMGQKDSVLATLAAANEAFPEDTTILKLYGATLVTMNKSDEASKLIAAYRESHDATTSMVYLQGLAARGEKDLDKAEKLFNEVLGDEQFGHQAHAQLSFIAGDRNDSLTAVREIEIADSIAPGKYAAERLRRYVTYRMYSKTFPMIEALLDNLNKQMQTEGETVDLQAEQGAAREPSVKDRYYAMLSLYADMQSRYAATLVYSSPDSSMAHYQTAYEACEQYLAAKPEDMNITFLRASILERQKKSDEAIAAFRAILAREPESHLAMNYLGYTLIELGRTPEEIQEGVALVDEALKREPEEISYLDSKGWGLFQQGKYKEAYEVFISLPAKQPSILQDFTYWEHLGRTLEALGEQDRAKECFNKLYELQPGHPFAKKP